MKLVALLTLLMVSACTVREPMASGQCFIYAGEMYRLIQLQTYGAIIKHGNSTRYILYEDLYYGAKRCDCL